MHGSSSRWESARVDVNDFRKVRFILSFSFSYGWAGATAVEKIPTEINACRAASEIRCVCVCVNVLVLTRTGRRV